MTMSDSTSVRRTRDMAQVVRAARARKAMTQTELAARAGVSQRWLSLFENNKTRGAELAKVLGVCAVLEVSLVATLPEAAE
jgi:transcriptional regulator with XRE-family HTH domain